MVYEYRHTHLCRHFVLARHLRARCTSSAPHEATKIRRGTCCASTSRLAALLPHARNTSKNSVFADRRATARNALRFSTHCCSCHGFLKINLHSRRLCTGRRCCASACPPSSQISSSLMSSKSSSSRSARPLRSRSDSTRAVCTRPHRSSPGAPHRSCARPTPSQRSSSS